MTPMDDRHLFYLDAACRWDLAWDRQQWMIRRHKGPRKAPPRAVGPGYSAFCLWEPRWSVGSEKRILHQFISGERGSGGLPEAKRPRIELTGEARARPEALPNRFLDWRDVVVREKAETRLSESPSREEAA